LTSNIHCCNAKAVKLKLSTPWRHIGEWRYRSTHSLTLALDGDEWSASCSGHFTPSTHRIGGWVDPELVWTWCLKNSQPPLGIKPLSFNHPACSQLLYRLSYPRHKNSILENMELWANHWTQSWISCIQSAPSHPISSRSILILSSHLWPSLSPKWYLPFFRYEVILL
jgi:hypothetical protein